MTSKRSETSKRGTILQTASEGQVADMVTMQETDPETLAAMVTMVNAMTREKTDGGDVAALAVLAVSSLWLNRRTPTMPPVAVAAVAVRKARRTMAGLVREAREAVADGDVMVEAVEAGAVSLAMASQWCPSPEARWMTGWGDALAAMVETVEDETAAAWLADAVAAWLAVEASGRMDGKGRPVTLAGAIGASKGWKASEAAGRASSRAVLAALQSLPVETVEAVLQTMAVRPGEAVPHGANRVTGKPRQSRRVREDWESVVVVRCKRDALGYPAALGYGEAVNGEERIVRRVSEREAANVAAPMAGAVPVGLATFVDDDGQTVAVREDRASAPDDRPARLPGDHPVHLPVRAVSPSPRKRAGSGSTGPTTTAW